MTQINYKVKMENKITEFNDLSGFLKFAVVGGALALFNNIFAIVYLIIT